MILIDPVLLFVLNARKSRPQLLRSILFFPIRDMLAKLNLLIILKRLESARLPEVLKKFMKSRKNLWKSSGIAARLELQVIYPCSRDCTSIYFSYCSQQEEMVAQASRQKEFPERVMKDTISGIPRCMYCPSSCILFPG